MGVGNLMALDAKKWGMWWPCPWGISWPKFAFRLGNLGGLGQHVHFTLCALCVLLNRAALPMDFDKLFTSRFATSVARFYVSCNIEAANLFIISFLEF